jgi:hypothetical protein
MSWSKYSNINSSNRRRHPERGLPAKCFGLTRCHGGAHRNNRHAYRDVADHGRGLTDLVAPHRTTARLITKPVAIAVCSSLKIKDCKIRGIDGANACDDRKKTKQSLLAVCPDLKTKYRDLYQRSSQVGRD